MKGKTLKDTIVGIGVGIDCGSNDAIAPLLRIVPWTPTITLSSKASPSGEVYPANNPYHSCKYSTGREPYNTIVMLLLLPV